MDDPNFIDDSNVLRHVSDGGDEYFPPIHLVDTICFKRPIDYMKEVQERHQLRLSNEAGLFPYYIEDPSKLSKDTLERLERYQILSDLNDENYHSNCFLYALKQTKYVPEDVINTLKLTLVIPIQNQRHWTLR